MIFTSVGSLGSANQFTSGGDDGIPFSPAATIDAGALVVLWTAWDNIFNLFVDTGCPLHDRIAVSDDVGNIWTMIAAGTGTNCFFFCHAYCGIFVSHLKNDITPTDTILTTGGVGNILEAKAVSLWEYEVEDGFSWAAMDDRFACLEERGGGPSPMSKNWGYTQEYLWLYGLGSEGPSTDNFTMDADYTAITQDGTNTGGAADENVTIVGGWRITDNISSDTATITNNTAARDTLQLFGAITPVRLPIDFPTQPVLDDFNRADEDPLDNGTWNIAKTAGPSSPGFRQMELISNEAAGGPTAAGGQFWDTFIDCNDVEVFTMASLINDTSSAEIDVIAHGEGSTHNATAEGYLAQFRRTSPGSPATYWHAALGDLGNGGGISREAIWLWLPDGMHPVSGSKIGIKRDGEYNHLYIDLDGGGWEWAGAINTLRGDRQTAGYLGLAIWDSVTRADDFGGGPLCFPQFYRRPFG